MKELHNERFGTSHVPECADEWFELIHDVAVNYDGCKSEKNLKELIGKMVEYADNARKCMRQGKLYPEHFCMATTIGTYETDRRQNIKIVYDGSTSPHMLYSARPNCRHKIKEQLSGGVKCVNCGGWFAY